MRFLGPAYLSIVRRIGQVPTGDQFAKLFEGIQMTDEDFNIEQYVPGTSGEAALFKAFKEKSGLSS
jgi:5,10-methenyltetrahydromethanopterin hydrogenase